MAARGHANLSIVDNCSVSGQAKQGTGAVMSSNRFARVVNSAFLSELKECNSPLWEDVNMLGSYTQEPFCADWIEQEAGLLLRRLREELSSHFRLEETFGYVAGPSLQQDRSISKAMDQHLGIVLMCVALSEQLDDLEYCGTLSSETLGIWHQMKKLYETIMEHEALERRLCASDWAPILPEARESVDVG